MNDNNRGLAELLCALAYATGLGFGGHTEHALRTAYLALQMADALGLSGEEREAVFYGALLKDAACTACRVLRTACFPDNEQIFLRDILVDPSRLGDMISFLQLDGQSPQRIYRLLAFFVQCGTISVEIMQTCCEVDVIFARSLGFPDYVQETLTFRRERWDSQGMAYQTPNIPLSSRILDIAQTAELIDHFIGADAALGIVKRKRGIQFDPGVVDVFLRLSQDSHFWQRLQEGSRQEVLLSRCPPTVAPSRLGSISQIERICEILADFVDMKSRGAYHHSRSVAEIAEKIGISLGMKRQELIRLKCAALLHDIGKLAVPRSLLWKEEPLTAGELDILKLHPFYAFQILNRSSALRDFADVASTDHEWMNGQGYHRRLRGEQLPFHGRILAVANGYVRLIQTPGEQIDQAEALGRMQSLVDIQFDRICYDALTRIIAEGLDNLRSIPYWLRKREDLTEREKEILSLLTRGLSNPEIAHDLGISRRTVEQHLSNIYTKIGVSGRTAAVVYAIEQGLI